MRTVIFAVAAVALLGSREARACGGFFCNAAQPVNQTGERILFSQDEEGRLVTYVQVQYTGAPENFSWVVPVLGVPEVKAGTDVLFEVLERETSPRFVAQSCPVARYVVAKTGSAGCFDPTYGCGDSAFHGGGRSFTFVPPPPPDILAQGDAGPYTYTVIDAGDEDELFGWLSQNSFAVTARGQQLLRSYLREGYHFLAVKLQPRRSVGDLRPLVLRSDEPQPCIPLRLTAVAAQEDMPVRAWVLGSGRAVPDRWLHAEVNDARLDWTTGGGNYEQLVSEAVDEAGGQAFVTDFAGPTGPLAGVLWSEPRLGGVDPRDAAALEAAGIPGNAVLTALRDRWARSGADVEVARAELEAEVLEPLREAQELLDGSPYLTRLYTRVSPEEMLTDPTFTYSDELEDIPAERVAYDGWCVQGLGAGLLLPSGRLLSWVEGSGGPAAPMEAGPAAVRIDRFEITGRRSLVADHTADVPREVQVGSSGCAGCRASFRGGGWAWALVGAWLLLRRRW